MQYLPNLFSLRLGALILACWLGASPVALLQAQKAVSLEDIWAKYSFVAKRIDGLNWMKDGRYYTAKDGNKVVKYDVTTGQQVEVIFGKDNHPKLEFQSYSINGTEDKIVFVAEEEAIYRRSSKGKTYVFDLKTNELKAIPSDEKQSNATLSPDGSRVAFVRNNNIYIVTLNDLRETAVTTDGKANEIINGMADWVYEEEFSFTQALFWSPDGQRLAYYRFDERQVPEFNMQMWPDALYPQDYRFKYPKAGEPNAIVSIRVYEVANAKTQTIDLGNETDIYIPRINWTTQPDLLSIRRMNRLQNQLELLHANLNNGQVSTILTEKAPTYVDLDFTDDLTYLADGKQFIWSSERSGFKHLYLYDMQGKLVRPLTEGNWEVQQFLGIDEKRKTLYYTSNEPSATERHLYAIGLNGKGKTRLTQPAGVHSIDFSHDFKYYVNTYSAANLPTQVGLHTAPDGKLVKVLQDNQDLQARLKDFRVQPKEFMTVKAADGTDLNAWIIKPHNFDENKQYPLLMFVYGGPGSQQVMNQWDSFNYFWYQVLAEKGYVIACVDNRGTGGKGEQFKKITYGQLGKHEVADQITAAKYFGSQPYIDANRIGIWGWSYGGYMSSLCILLGNDVFKAAIAVAPVTTWRFYDTIYTERYLGLPQQNAKGYDEYSPLLHADKLKGNYLLIHGTGDDNVHFQNAVALQNALIKAGKQFQSFFYPDRNHGIYGGNTRLHLYQMMTDFIEKSL
ncbi:S9 family peptidase [Eisenibacter elegans]|jgi:dipeptidyl-peptidase-4|uniref:S9 family peptidase n=1 Tax=Eisenibacter elegans TaxID=997 RepID=UPI0004059F96|nr:S9 family peptidase [Eisenibacter elegans]